MRGLLVFAVVFGSLPFILWRPWIGVLVWSWLAYMNPHRLTWGFAFDFPFSLTVAAVMLVAIVLSREPKRIPWTGLTAVWLTFFIWTWVTTQFAIQEYDATIEWSRWWRISLVSVITILLMGSRFRLHCLVWVIAISLGFFGVKGGIFTIMTGGNHMVLGPPLSFIGDNTTLAMALIMILPLVRYLHLETENRWLRLALVFSMVMITASIFGSFSRGALLGVVAMGLSLLWKSPNRFTLSIAALMLIPFMWSFMPDQWHEKMGTIKTYEEDGSAMGRINAWWFAFNLAKDRPLVGGGFRTFGPSVFRIYAPDPEDHHDAHSIYFEVLGEHGFVGIFLFLLLGLVAFRTGSWVTRKARDGPEELRWAGNLASMLQVSLVGYWAAGAFLGLAYFDLYYALIAMMVLVRAEVQKVLEGQEETSHPLHPANIKMSPNLAVRDTTVSSWSR